MSSLYGAMGPQSAFRGPTGQMQQGQRGGTGNIAGYKQRQLPQFTPEQMNLLQQMFGHVAPGSYTSRLAEGDPALFAEMEAPAMRQFAGLQGNIANRFSGMGQGATKSSGFQNYMGQAASDFAQDLASRRQGLQRQAIQDLYGMGESLLGQRPYLNYLEPEEPGFFKRLLGGLGNIAGQFLGSGAQRAGSNFADNIFNPHHHHRHTGYFPGEMQRNPYGY